MTAYCYEGQLILGENLIQNPNFASPDLGGTTRSLVSIHSWNRSSNVYLENIAARCAEAGKVC